ncbi:MAG: hypothetical protein AAFX81_01040 [Pseudomonadota bacterium]
MFGLSLTKILVTVLIVVALWRLLGYFERRRGRRGRVDRQATKAIEFKECPECGDYVANGTTCPRCRGSA